MYWIVGKKGLLARSFAAYLKSLQLPFVSTGSDEIDIAKLEQVRDFVSKHHFTYIVNAAAYTDVDRAEIEGEKAFSINALGPKHLAVTAKQYHAKLIHISTDYVFDGISEYPYSETDICNPINVYGMTKLYGEQYVQTLNEEVLIIRTSWLYGEGGNNFPEKIIHALKTRDKLSVVDDQCSAPTYVHDLSQAIFDLKDKQGIFHFSNAGFISRYVWALVIGEILAQKGTIACKFIAPVSSDILPVDGAQRPIQTSLLTKKYQATLDKMPPDWLDSFKRYMENL